MAEMKTYLSVAGGALAGIGAKKLAEWGDRSLYATNFASGKFTRGADGKPSVPVYKRVSFWAGVAGLAAAGIAASKLGSKLGGARLFVVSMGSSLAVSVGADIVEEMTREGNYVGNLRSRGLPVQTHGLPGPRTGPYGDVVQVLN